MVDVVVFPAVMVVVVVVVVVEEVGSLHTDNKRAALPNSGGHLKFVAAVQLQEEGKEESFAATEKVEV